MNRTTFTWLVVGGIGWAGVVAIGLGLATSPGGSLGFDLELLLHAGRDVAAGRSPYDPALIAGTSPESTSLFYSYPPPVAQAFVLVAGVPSGVALVAWSMGAVAGLALVAEQLRRVLSPERRTRDVVIAAVGGSPLVLPFAVGILFGNLDVWFPFLYGTMLVAANAPSGRNAIGAGLALGAASLKLHPGSLGLWFLVRGVADPGRQDRRALNVVLIAFLALAVVVALSLVVGGSGPWLDYAGVVRAGAGADITDPRNAGPAALLAGLVNGDDAFARALHLVVGVTAVGITVLAAWRRRDPVESFAWAAAASLATLPVTWYHYPSALIPVGIAALLRAPTSQAGRVRALIVAAVVMAALALAWLALLWAAVALVILAARASAWAPSAVRDVARAAAVHEGG